MMIKMTEKQRNAFLKTVAHLPEAEQAIRLARREKSFHDEQFNNVTMGLKADGVDVGYGLGEAARKAK